MRGNDYFLGGRGGKIVIGRGGWGVVSFYLIAGAWGCGEGGLSKDKR